MVKIILSVFLFITLMLLLVVYFIGDYAINISYFMNQAQGKEAEVERNLVLDEGKNKTESYYLRVTNKGKVEFKKNFAQDRDSREFIIDPANVAVIREKMDSTGIFKLVSLNRTYCFNKFEAKIRFSFDWINKSVDYSHCADDPLEVKEFRKFIYEFLGLELMII
jgi:hypothetical protein